MSATSQFLFQALSVAAAVEPPNPAPRAPEGLTEKISTIVAWAKWGVMVLGGIGLLMCAGKMALGQTGRSHLAADGATGVPWVLLGLSLAAAAAGIAGVFL